MANRTYTIEEEFEVTLTLKVKVKQISTYFSLTESGIKDTIESFKQEITDHLKSKVTGDYFEEVTLGVDYWKFDVE